MSAYAAQRAADAAFFEDWSAWASLDDLPPPDRPHGYHLQRPQRHNRYWCCLRRRINWMEGAAFELTLPPSAPIRAMVRRLPGARQHPGLHGINRHALAGLSDTWFIPARSWRPLRVALPSIKQAVLAWVGRRDGRP